MIPNIGDIFNIIFLGPVINLLVVIYQAFAYIHLPGALGFSIIALTVLIRLLVWPFMSAQMKSTSKIAQMKPHLDALQKKHKDDKQGLAAAQMALYKEHGVNPAGGCLPSLIQLPLVLALYQTIQSLFNGAAGLGRINAFLYNSAWQLPGAPDLYFLGLNLASKPSEFSKHGISAYSLLLLLIPLITAGLQFIQSKMMTPKPVAAYPNDSKKELKEKEKSDDTMSAVQSQMSFMMPMMIGYFSFISPFGLSIYWNTFTLFGIYQQYRISGWGQIADLSKKLGSFKNKS